jgi:two-component system, chemotaxis family, sensor kinase CheA
VSEDLDLSTGMPSDEMAQYLQMFVDETAEQLDALVEVLLVLESEPNSSSHLNESFRLIHSIKGAAAMMGLDGITLLTHHLENHFERLRSGLWTLDRPMMNLVLKCVDYLREATDKLREGKPLVSAPELIELLSSAQPVEENPKSEPLSSSKQVAAPSSVETPTQEPPNQQEQLPTPPRTLTPKPTARRRVILYLDKDIELPELKAELIVVQLRSVGVVVRTNPEASQLESVAALRTLQVWIDTDRSDDELRAVADIVGVELIEIDAVEPEDENDSVTESATETKAAAVQIAKPTDTEQKPAAAPAIEPPTETVERVERGSKVGETVRVDLQRLDRLMNLAGELIVQRARFAQLGSQLKETFQKSGLQSRLRELCEVLKDEMDSEISEPESPNHRSVQSKRFQSLKATVDALEDQLQVLELGRRSYHQLNEAIDQFSRVSEGLQRGVLDTRMIPVGPLFSRFKRTVRDISEELGKKVHYVIRGENTELDKRMIDELGDPLVHLVRNAIDHGIESEQERLKKGKPAFGTLSLEAEHRGNNVLITISDDGGGIHSEKVRRRAIERGLATEAELELMSDFEIQQFIWAPGFSTAEVVSDISGRGVGMDIVRNRIRELSGTIEVHSVPGEGTRFVLRLPLTLAIIRSLLFRLDHGIFAAPIEHVREIVSVQERDILTVHQRNTIDVRGDFIPLVRIGDVFDWGTSFEEVARSNQRCSTHGSETSNVVILTVGSKLMGLVVADLMGCQDIVVKSLDENFTTIRGLSGASILGDGSVCLLLDVASCIELARSRLREESYRAS